MRKLWVIAVREYLAAVRTKTFIVSLVVMPLLMGGSVLVQTLLKDVVDTSEKRYALIDRIPGRDLTAVIQAAVDAYNSKVIDTAGRQLRPRLVLDIEPPQAEGKQRYELSEKVRKGQLAGFLELLDGSSEPLPSDEAALRGGLMPRLKPSVIVRYETNRPTDNNFAEMVKRSVGVHVQTKLGADRGLAEAELRVMMNPVLLQLKPLSVLDPETGQVKEAAEQSQMASVVVPMGVMLLMFMVVLMCATPLMQGVVEEKMQRIAEVLLGSVQPFPLMMGKLLGMAAVSLTIAAVYLSGAYWAAHHYGFAEYIGLDLLLWFLLFQTLAALMFGSLFIAIGAACTDMKETQNLLWPVMLLATFPMFLLANVLREPNGPAVVGVSFFPFATPTLMMARMATPPGIPWWQPLVGVLGVLATTVVCVYVAGRIFRVGLLMQGKGARFTELFKWVFRG
ncbi:MAG TPA: ABC transporter permease [Gemmataceae bacterium]|nr:ABC transporter permease [Gemmataceae bacterium]